MIQPIKAIKPVVAGFILTISLLISHGEAKASPTPLEAVQELVGIYSGHWDMFGLDGAGNPQLTLSWDDKITFSDPQVGVDPFVGKTRAFGRVTNTMTYKYPRTFPSMTIQFTEGFTLLPDGGVGDHYFSFKSADGVVLETIETKVQQNLWTYNSAVKLDSFKNLGITKDNFISAKNVVVKSIVVEGKTEIQLVTQTTYLVWKTSNGLVRTKEFVSMTGIHKRTL